MSKIEGFGGDIESSKDSVENLKDRLNNLSNEFPREYEQVLKKSQDFTVSGVIDVVIALKNRDLESKIPSSLLDLVDIDGEKIKLKERIDSEYKLTLTQSKDLVNSWVNVLKNISSIHKQDSKSLTTDLSEKDKAESEKFFELSRKALNKLKAVVNSDETVELNEQIKKDKVIANLKDTFGASLSQNLEWKDNFLEFKVNG